MAEKMSLGKIYCITILWLQPSRLNPQFKSPTSFFLGNRHYAVQGVRVCDWSSEWKVLSVFKLLRKQGGEWESPGIEHFSAKQTLGPGDTRTCSRSDKWTQGSRDFSREERSNSEIEAGLGWGYWGLGREVTEMVTLWVCSEWWAWRREGG